MTQNPPGQPVWYELIAEDADAAQAFYTRVVGWNAGDSGMPGMDYRILSAPDGEGVAGLMPRGAGMPAVPFWLVYFGTPDVDAAAAAVTAGGGAIHMPPSTMPGVGRMAMAADPHGALFYLMRGESDAPSTAFLTAQTARPGHAVWNELTTPDQDAAMAFYGGVVGLRHEGAMPMGPLGDYRFVHAGDVPVGASMRPPPDGRAGWMPYFLVDDIDAGAGRVGDAGGTIVQPPVEIPGGGYSLVAEDPQAVRFGLVGDRKGETA